MIVVISKELLIVFFPFFVSFLKEKLESLYTQNKLLVFLGQLSLIPVNNKYNN